MKTLCFYSALLLMVNACQNFQRSRESGYGMGAATPATKVIYSSEGPQPHEETQNFTLKQRINYLEKKLTIKSEKEHYSRILPWFENDEERLEYLLLPNLERKETWSNEHYIWQRSGSPSDQTVNLIKNQDIAVGMPREYVRKSWGEPNAVDISGDPLFLNERWRYNKYISSSQGYHQEKKTIYFEGGKVVGWSTD